MVLWYCLSVVCMFLVELYFVFLWLFYMMKVLVLSLVLRLSCWNILCRV